MDRRIAVGLNAVIVAVTEDEPRVLTVARDGARALPYGPLDADRHATLELGLRAWVREQTGLDLGYVEQLYTFGDRERDPERGERHLSIVYLALVRETAAAAEAAWRPVYDFLPWEDWRTGPPAILERVIRPALERWAPAEAPAERRERRDLAFGFGGVSWDAERVLKRYELLYEAGLVSESGPRGEECGRAMLLDHRRMLATGLSRLRGKIKYRPVIFELLGERFTLWQLQRVVEALAGRVLHKQNFRRLVTQGGLVEGTGRRVQSGKGRPAELFRFRRAVMLERPSPGVGLPVVRDRA